MRPLTAKLVDFALLQVGWFACVLGGASGNAWIGPVTAAAFVAVHLGQVVPPGSRGRQLRRLLLWGLIGCVLDALQVRLGVLSFPGDAVTVAGIPPWLAALWFLFPILFDTTLAWLHGRPWLAAALALIGSPLSYRAGVALGALDLGTPEWLALTSLGVTWAVYLPLALRQGGEPLPGTRSPVAGR